MYEPGVAQHHLCNIQVGDWNCVNKSRIRVTIILIALLAITIISKVLLLMCVLTWCYRHFRKPDQTCARQLDPDDPSVVLCEDLDNLDKCLCYGINQEQNKRGKNLHEQTVNVSYYPFASSPFSSGKTSSKSSRKYSSSNTTTSAVISFAEGEESSEESGNTNQTLYCDDEINDQVAYGVYCGIADDEEDDEEEEEEESESPKHSASDKRSGKSN